MTYLVYVITQKISKKVTLEKIYLKQKDIPKHFPFLSKARIIELKKNGDFPPGKIIGERRIWTTTEIETWMDERDD